MVVIAEEAADAAEMEGDIAEADPGPGAVIVDVGGGLHRTGRCQEADLAQGLLPEGAVDLAVVLDQSRILESTLIGAATKARN